MKRPTWATIIGVLAIIFGIIGILSGAQEMAMPSMIETQKEVQKEMMSNLASGANGIPAPPAAGVANMMEAMNTQLELPEWYMSWAPIMGLLSIVIASIYLASGVFLLIVKQFAVKLFYVAIGLSILWAAIQAVIFEKTGVGIIMAQMAGSVASLAIDIVLLFVVLFCSKEAFSPEVEKI